MAFISLGPGSSSFSSLVSPLTFSLISDQTIFWTWNFCCTKAVHSPLTHPHRSPLRWHSEHILHQNCLFKKNQNCQEQQELGSASLISDIGFIKTQPNNLWQLMEGGYQTDEERPQGSWWKGDFWLDLSSSSWWLLSALDLKYSMYIAIFCCHCVHSVHIDFFSPHTVKYMCIHQCYPFSCHQQSVKKSLR